MKQWLKTNGLKAFLLVLWIGLILLVFHFRKEISLNVIVSDSPANQFLAGLSLLGMFALKSVSFFIYIGLLYMAAGLLFAYPAAVLVCMAGTLIAVSIPYALGRFLEKGSLDTWMKKYPKLESFSARLREKGFVTVFLMRTIARLPSDVVSMFCGMQKVEFPVYLLASFLSFLPHIVTFPLLARSYRDPGSVPFLFSVGVEIIWMVVCLLLYRRRETRKQKDDPQ